MKQTLFLLDGMALAFRAYYGFLTRPRTNSLGVNTSAVYGFTMTLLKLIMDFDLKHGAVVMDAGEKTFRSELFSDYKATRDAPPEAIINNLPLIKSVVESLGLPFYQVAGVEADDVIGTLARQVEREGYNAIIVSSDKDFRQLLSPHVSIYKPRSRGEGFDHVTIESFEESYQLKPYQYIDVLALMGDRVDNVPGIRGIGEKTAIALLQAYGTLENLLEHAAEIKAKRAREGLLAEADMARLSKMLVTIKLDVDASLDWEAARCAELSSPKVHSVFRRLEFTSLLGRLGVGAQLEEAATTEGSTKRSYDAAHANYRLVTDRRQLIALERTLARQQALGLHALNDGLPPAWADWVGLSVSWANETACYIPLPMPDGTSQKEVLGILAPILTNANVVKVGHGIKPLLVLQGLSKVQAAGPVFDTEVAHYLLAPDTNHSLRFVARERLRYDLIDWNSVTGTGRERRALRELAPADLMAAACEFAALSLELMAPLQTDLDEKGLRRVAMEMEFPLVYSLAHMEMAGVMVNKELLDATGKSLQKKIAVLEGDIFARAGRMFNIASSQQVGVVLFGQMGLPVRHKTSSGKPSTRENVLVELAAKHEICGMILDWRKATRLVGTYIAGLGRWIHPETGRVHTVFNQTTAATGRLSSSDPGLQNIPNRTASGRELRRAFVAQPAWKLLSADYSQIELRILAHMSGDESLTQIFLDGRDPHTETAARIHHVEANCVTLEQRSKAKAVNYGIPYGLSASGLAQQLRCSIKDARALMDSHRESFPGVHRFLSEQVEEARARGYAVTLWGRRRYLPDLQARNRMVRSAAERVAVNMPIQGTQADMIKLAMVGIDRTVAHRGLRMRMVLQVHDELLFEVPPYEVAEAEVLVHDAMVNALALDIPIEVNLNTGPTWLDVH